jgi:hypothetical protein
MEEKQNLHVHVSCNFSDGKSIHYSYTVPAPVLEEIAPTRLQVLEPYQYLQEMQKEEKRQAFINSVAANIAHALTQTILEKAE